MMRFSLVLYLLTMVANVRLDAVCLFAAHLQLYNCKYKTYISWQNVDYLLITDVLHLVTRIFWLIFFLVS